MYKIIVFLFLTTLLYSKNPKIYGTLGDRIYDNVNNIEKLKDIEICEKYKSDIDIYVKNVVKTKGLGFGLENGYKPVDRKTYLDLLRDLSKKNDFFIRLVEKSFNKALNNNDNELFLELINSGLLNGERYKNKILNYYYRHSNEIELKGILKKYVIEDQNLKNAKKSNNIRYETKRERELRKIQRIREKDRLRQERLEKQLEEKLKNEKQKIREYQERELSKTI